MVVGVAIAKGRVVRGRAVVGIVVGSVMRVSEIEKIAIRGMVVQLRLRLVWRKVHVRQG